MSKENKETKVIDGEFNEQENESTKVEETEKTWKTRLKDGANWVIAHRKELLIVGGTLAAAGVALVVKGALSDDDDDVYDADWSEYDTALEIPESTMDDLDSVTATDEVVDEA